MSEPVKEAHTHCWHRGGSLTSPLASYPPQHQETCCHCGAVQFVSDPVPPIPEGHGPHHPNAPVVNRIGYSRTDQTARCICRVENGGSGVCNCVLGCTTTYTASVDRDLPHLR